MKRSRAVTPGLKHLAFFEELADKSHETPSARAAIAGLLTLRLVDHWVLAGAVMVEPESVSVRSLRQAIMAIAANDPQREVLFGVVNTMQTLREVDLQPVLPRLFAFAELTERRGMLALAADVYASIARLGKEDYDGDLVIDSGLRLGYCLRMLGALNEAEEAYLTAGRIAKRQREAGRLLRSRIGLANVLVARGNLPKADMMFDEIVGASRSAGSREVESMALHDQSIVAQRRSDFDRAVCLAFGALQLSQSEHHRERILGDLGAFFVAMGRHEAARDALLIEAATAITPQSRIVATINLLSLAARERDSALFHTYREQLTGIALPPDMEANFLIETARGLRSLGEWEHATELLEKARDIGEKHQLNRVVFEVESMLESAHAPAETTSGRQPTIPSAAAAHVERELRALAASLPA